MTQLATVLRDNKLAKIGEITVLFAIPTAVIIGAAPLAGDDPVRRQMVVWVANLLMLGFVWFGLRARGESWQHFGLSWKRGSARSMLRPFLLSLVVLVAALAGFVFGSIVGANIVGIPESADLSTYDYMRGNLPMLLIALAGVYVASSFGEEVIYRGFLINRIAELGGSGKTAVRVAVVVSSLIFGLIHFDWGVMGIMQTTFMGLALGISYLLVKRNLWVLILAHAYMDTVLMVQMYLGVGGEG